MPTAACGQRGALLIVFGLIGAMLAPITATAGGICGLSTTGAGPTSGLGSTATGGFNAFACGFNSSSSGNFATAVGTYNATAAGDGSVAIGASVGAGVAVPSTTFSTPGPIGGVAIGLNALSTGNQATAVGGTNATTGTQATGDNSSAFGSAAVANATGATAIGYTSLASANDAIAIGTQAQAGGTSGIAIGRQAQANNGQYNVAIGDFAFINPNFSQTTAIGGGPFAVNGSSTVTLGYGAGTFFNDASNNSVAVGVFALVDGNNSTAVGQGAAALGASSTALGQGASAGFANSTAIGAGATTTRANQVAVGTATSTYTLPSVTSAASLAAQSGPVSLVTTDTAGNLATLSTSNIASVAALSALDGRVTNLENNVRSLNADMRKAFEGSAVAIAMGGAALPDNKKFAISANWGNFSGENAFGGMALPVAASVVALAVRSLGNHAVKNGAADLLRGGIASGRIASLERSAR